jgi:hypothetical protein
VAVFEIQSEMNAVATSVPARRCRGSLPMRFMMFSAIRRWRSHCCMAAAIPIPPANRKM